ncbi:sigma factor-like helix-turn-helix DNA-binding protein [Streptomyces sp. NPDC058417]|uniref:sigma factor-like helix-turn-helix DNA-binding protein n=1 Tax=unclassified Streptomyces TaxID=2593676 RepID=UPI003647378F
MRARRTAQNARRAREFEAFVAGAGGRLLHTATLLTAEDGTDHPHARRLLTHALAQTYADWDRLHGEDPYDRARRHLVLRFDHTAWYRHGVPWRPGTAGSGPLAGLTARERLVLVLRLYEGVAEEQTAALLGLPVERVHAVCDRAAATLLHPPREPAPVRSGVEAATP